MNAPLPLPAAIFGGLLALGLLGGGGYIGDGLGDMFDHGRTVSVRGLAEREVKADHGSLPISLGAEADSLAQAQAALDRDVEAVRRFLLAQGFPASEILLSQFSITDQHDRVFEKDEVRPPRWSVGQTITADSADVDRIDRTTGAINTLIRNGVVLESASTPSFSFSKLNDVRAPMIREATASARSGAEEFARDSGSRLNGIQEATQGSFEIVGLDESYSEDSQLWKRVRVVTTVSYRLG
jgi:hypothetical protein